MKFPFYIARRYLFSKSSNNAINFITGIAAFGIIIGSASLFIVLSGFAGLKDFTLAFSSFVDPDLKIMPAQGKSIILTDTDINILESNSAIASYSQVVEERVLINFENKNLSVTLKGIDRSFPAKTIDSIMSRGQWLDYESNEIVSGWGVANTLGFGIFDFAKTIDIYVPKPGVGQITSVRSAFNTISATNSGVFQVNENLDYNFIYGSLPMAQHLLGYNSNQCSAIELTLDQSADRETLREDLQKHFQNRVVIKDRFQLNDALYKMLNTENLAVYLIFTLVLIIALFNVIGSIIMMILDKKHNLNTLFNLGATISEIRQIFFLQGSLMSVLGGLIGLGLGLLLVFLQKVFGLVMITPSLEYPVSIKPWNVVLVFLTISVLGIIASKLASSRIDSKLVHLNQANW